MKLSEITAPLLCAVLLAACASQPKEPPRIKLNGFSIAPPDEEWVIARQTPEQLILGKPGQFSGETFSMQAVAVRLPLFSSGDELLRYVETAQRKELDPKRFRILDVEVSPHVVKGESCALSHLQAVDRSAAGGTSSPVNTLLETLTLACSHPNDRTRGINMTYSHKYYPEDRDPQFVEHGAALLQNLEFDPL